MRLLAEIGLPGVWDDYILAVAAIVVALSAIWMNVVRPVVRAASRAGEVADTLLEIASEFKPDHGSSLKDVLTAVQQDVARATAVAEDIRSMNQRLGEVEESLVEVEQHLGIRTET